MNTNNSVLPPISVSSPSVVKTKTSRSIPVQIPAGVLVNGTVVPGEAAQITSSGDRFYVLAASAPITIQPYRAGSVGSSNSFNQGQGQTVEHGFENLKITNFSLFAVVALVWIGFDDFIDNQLIINQTTNPAVTYPTQNTPTATHIEIPDLSGQAFLDINGKRWLAIYRVAVIVSNVSAGTTLLLQKANANVSNGPSVLAIPPGLPLAHNSSGNFSLDVGGGVVPAIVSEIYSAIPG